MGSPPSSPVRERERKTDREIKREKEGGKEKEREREGERDVQNCYFYFKRNVGCLGTFQLYSIYHIKLLLLGSYNGYIFQVIKNLIPLAKLQSDQSKSFFQTCKHPFSYTCKHPFSYICKHTFFVAEWVCSSPGRRVGYRCWHIQLHLVKQQDPC